MSTSAQTFQPPKAWELSLYELHRTPQEAITDDTEIALSPRSLHSELMCPICLDMLTNTMTTKECLHRFCHDCIITALRAGNKECPTCRKKLISKRSLRRDPNFDSLIEKIYPDRDEYEAQQDAVLEKLNQHTNQQALTSSIEEGLRIQAQHRLQRMLKQQRKAAEAATQEEEAPPQPPDGGPATPDTPAPGSSESLSESQPTTHKERKRKNKDNVNKPSTSATASSAPETDAAGSSALPEIDDIELIFRPHPSHISSMEHCETRYLKTTVNANVNHLRTFLTMRLALERGSTVQAVEAEKSYNIYVMDQGGEGAEDGEGGTYEEIQADVPLGEIQTRYWKEGQPLELFYVEVNNGSGGEGEGSGTGNAQEEGDGEGKAK